MSKEEIEAVISVVGAMTTGFFSLVTIIVTYRNAKKQIQESEKARIQQKEQYEESLKLQKEQYERELEYSRNIEKTHEKPYFVFVKSSDFDDNNLLCNTLTITFKNKGNGTAFHIIPDIESESLGYYNKKIHIVRNAPVQDPIAMVGENFKTYWEMDKLNTMIGVVIPIKMKYKDASGRSYSQTFNFTIDDTGNVMVTNYAVPELIEDSKQDF